VRGEKRLVGLYKRRIVVERAFKASKLELSMEKPKWRGVAKIRMHVAICLLPKFLYQNHDEFWPLHPKSLSDNDRFSCILAVAIAAHKIGRPELANSIAAFTY
jgi:hypothetical protein